MPLTFSNIIEKASASQAAAAVKTPSAPSAASAAPGMPGRREEKFRSLHADGHWYIKIAPGKWVREKTGRPARKEDEPALKKKKAPEGPAPDTVQIAVKLKQTKQRIKDLKKDERALVNKLADAPTSEVKMKVLTDIKLNRQEMQKLEIQSVAILEAKRAAEKTERKELAQQKREELKRLEQQREERLKREIAALGDGSSVPSEGAHKIENRFGKTRDILARDLSKQSDQTRDIYYELESAKKELQANQGDQELSDTVKKLELALEQSKQNEQKIIEEMKELHQERIQNLYDEATRYSKKFKEQALTEADREALRSVEAFEETPTDDDLWAAFEDGTNVILSSSELAEEIAKVKKVAEKGGKKAARGMSDADLQNMLHYKTSVSKFAQVAGNKAQAELDRRQAAISKVEQFGDVPQSPIQLVKIPKRGGFGVADSNGNLIARAPSLEGVIRWSMRNDARFVGRKIETFSGKMPTSPGVNPETAPIPDPGSSTPVEETVTEEQIVQADPETPKDQTFTEAVETATSTEEPTTSGAEATEPATADSASKEKKKRRQKKGKRQEAAKQRQFAAQRKAAENRKKKAAKRARKAMILQDLELWTKSILEPDSMEAFWSELCLR
jgi:hypothetical protein